MDPCPPSPPPAPRWARLMLSGVPLRFRWCPGVLSKWCFVVPMVSRLASQWCPNGVQVASRSDGAGDVPLVFVCLRGDPTGVPVVSQWCPGGFPLVLRWSPNGVPVGSVAPRGRSGPVPALSRSCPCGIHVVFLWCPGVVLGAGGVQEVSLWCPIPVVSKWQHWTFASLPNLGQFRCNIWQSWSKFGQV